MNDGADIDEAIAQSNLKIYEDLVRFSPVPTRFLERIVKTSDVLPGADLVVEWGSSICIEVAHLRIPCVSVSTEVGRSRLYSASKTRDWEPCVLGVSWEATDAAELKIVLFVAIGRGRSYDNLLSRQTEVYPTPPEKGASAHKMAETLLGFVNPESCSHNIPCV